MNRQDLVDKLALLKPALAKNNLIEAYTCFYFNDNIVIAYNDSVGIVTYLSHEMANPFAVDGATLLGLLENSESEEVEFEPLEEYVEVRSGNSIIKLPYLTDYPFMEPDMNCDIKLNDELIEAIEACLMTSSGDLTQEAISGVVFRDGMLYSCDGDALTRYHVPIKTKTYMVTNEFCDALLNLWHNVDNSGGQPMLGLDEDWAVATMNGFKVFGRMRPTDNLLDHEKLIKQTVKGKEKFAAAPSGLMGALNRARVVADVETAPTRVVITDGKMILHTELQIGTSVNDDLTIKHPNVTARVHANLMQRSLTLCNEFCITERATVYRSGVKILQVVGNAE